MPGMTLTPVAQLYPPSAAREVDALRVTIVAFKPDAYGAPWELGRALAPAERQAFAQRKAEIEYWLQTASPERATEIITRTLIGLAGAAYDDEEAQMVAAQYAFACRDLPYWALERTCARFARGEVRASELGAKHLDPGFRPSTAQLCLVARVLTAPLERERDEIGAILKGVPVGRRGAATEGPRGVVEGHLGDAYAAEERERERKAEQVRLDQPQVEARTNAARAEEYRRAGLEPPQPVHGLIVSLSMMMTMGFRIEEKYGRRALVGPSADRAES